MRVRQLALESAEAVEFLLAAPDVLLYIAGLGGDVASDREHRLPLDACRRSDQTAAVDLLNTHLDHAADALVARFRGREARR